MPTVAVEYAEESFASRTIASRNVQIVSKKSDRKPVTEWMIAEAEESGSDKNIAGKAVMHFPQLFRQPNRTTRYAKAYQWWKSKDEFFQKLAPGSVDKALHLVSQRASSVAVRRHPIKACTDRGRKRPQWKDDLHELLLSELGASVRLMSKYRAVCSEKLL